MKLNLKNTPEQVELMKALGSKDPSISRPALEAIAAFIAPVAQKVLSVAGTASMIYRDVPYGEDDSPSIPLDLFYGANVNSVTVWSQTMAGGVPTSLISGLQELKFQAYDLTSAVSFLKKYARKGRLDVLSAAIKRMTEEILVKQERNAWAVIVKALAEASTNGLAHFISANTANVFQVADLNSMMTRLDRINTSFGGYTTDATAGLTDLFISPEIMEQVRSFSYQPMNTRVPYTEIGTAANTLAPGTVALPDGVREEIYRSAGASEIFGVALTKMLELGDGKPYSALFDEWYSGSFTTASDQFVLGLDASQDAFLRPVETTEGNGGTITVLPDDQFVARADKTGFYASLNEARVCVRAQAIVGCKV